VSAEHPSQRELGFAAEQHAVRPALATTLSSEERALAENAPREPSWPAAPGRIVFLLDAASALEERLLRDWIQRADPAAQRHEGDQSAASARAASTGTAEGQRDAAIERGSESADDAREDDAGREHGSRPHPLDAAPDRSSRSHKPPSAGEAGAGGAQRGEAERSSQRPGSSQRLAIAIPASRRRRGEIGLDLEAALAAPDDATFAPLRVVWMAPTRQGVRAARWSDLLWLGDPRDPDRVREHLILRLAPQRCRIVAAEPARASELRERWRRNTVAESSATLGFAPFVVRQAHLALERAERRLRGARYKIPRFVREEILARPAFRGEIALLAGRLGRTPGDVLREAEADLREIAAAHRPTVIDLVVQVWRWSITRGYGGVLHYDSKALDRVRALSQHHSVVFLPTHKSNLDHAVLQVLLHENGMPQNHTAGGINMNFFPAGPLVRRAGVFFIRRTFKDDEVYKCVLRHYVDYLVEKRFPLEWYIEGGRSRSGKLLPPRFGLLAYVVDAYRRGRCEDVHLIPVSIAYDQISDVSDYAAEQRGGEKEREGIAWLVRFLRRMRKRYGRIHVRFGEDVSLAKALGTPNRDAAPDADEDSLALQKLAFEVCVRINRATPITPISLVCLSLLGRGSRALSAYEVAESLRNLVGYVRARGLPVTEEIALDVAGLPPLLDQLVGSGLLHRFDEGPEVVYGIAPEQHLAAAYYRNTVIHFFVTGAIAELALLRAAEPNVADRRAEFWNAALALRDLLKFEFFFPDREHFVAELRAELAMHVPSWERALEAGPDEITGVPPRLRPFHAHRILRPFLEAYRVVADALEHEPASAKLADGAFLKRCLALGKQYLLQGRVAREESVSQALFATALKLARHRGLVESAAPDLTDRRRAFAAELRDGIRRVDAIEALVRARIAGILE
jgi:glycerol-3-phosphate O-acyltransferase